jgi:hypothetical protein
MFRRVSPPSYEGIVDEFRGGPVTIAVLAYAFGQYRIQCWYARPGAAPDVYPDILEPEC